MTENELDNDSPHGGIELHARYVSNIKRAANELLKKKAIPAAKAPVALGLRPLRMAVPPMFEAALGYRGQLRFVAFHFSPTRAVPVHSDGGDDLPIPNANDWITFVSHPAVCPQLEEYSSLLGRLGTRRLLAPEQFQELEDEERLGYCSRFHALVLDRQERIFYTASWQALKMFQPYSEPDGEEVHLQLESGVLVSPGNEDYTSPPSRSIVGELFRWLDNKVIEPGTQEDLARWHIHHGRPDEGAQILKAVLEKDPGRKANPRFQYDLSFLFRKQHDYQAALEALEACSRNARMGPYDHFALAQLYVEVGRFDETLQQLEIADRSYEPKDGEWYALKARALAGRGDYTLAVEICNEVLSNPPTEEAALGAAEIHLELAGIAALRMEYGVAAQGCHAALDKDYIDPESEMEDSIAVYRPAWWLSTQARLINAARKFEEAAIEKSANPAHVALGYLYLGMSRYRDAEESFRNAAATDGSSEVLWFHGISSLAAKERSRAENLFQEFTRRFPQDERGLVGLALCHAADGSIGQAFEYCDRAFQVNEQGGELHALRAFLNWSKGNYAEAAKEARLAGAAGFVVHHVLTCPSDEHSKSVRYLDSSVAQDDLRRLTFV